MARLQCCTARLQDKNSFSPDPDERPRAAILTISRDLDMIALQTLPTSLEDFRRSQPPPWNQTSPPPSGNTEPDPLIPVAKRYDVLRTLDQRAKRPRFPVSPYNNRRRHFISPPLQSPLMVNKPPQHPIPSLVPLPSSSHCDGDLEGRR